MQCFKVHKDEIEKRIDPHYYQPTFLHFEQLLNLSKYPKCKIKALAIKVTSGATPKSGGDAYTTKEFGIPFIRSGDINELNIVNYDDVIYIKPDIHNKTLRGSQLQKDDVLIAIVGATIGQVSVFKDEISANINQALALVRLNTELIIPEFLKLYMLSNLGQQELNKNKRPVARANLNLDEIRNINVVLPPLEIQNKIVELMQTAYDNKKQKEQEAENFLNSIDDFVLEQLGIQLPEMQNKMCYKVASNELKNNRHDAYYNQEKFKKLKEFLQKDNFVPFNDLIEIITKGETPLWRGDSYTEEGIPFLKVQNISPEGLKEDITYIPEEVHNRMKRSQLKGNELLYSMAGTIGIATIYPNSMGEANINQAIAKIIPKNANDTEYLALILNAKICKMQAEMFLTMAAQPNINFEQIKTIKIPYPEKEIRDNILNEVKNRMQQAKQLQHEATAELEEAKARVERIILGEET